MDAPEYKIEMTALPLTKDSYDLIIKQSVEEERLRCANIARLYGSDFIAMKILGKEIYSTEYPGDCSRLDGHEDPDNTGCCIHCQVPIGH